MMMEFLVNVSLVEEFDDEGASINSQTNVMDQNVSNDVEVIDSQLNSKDDDDDGNNDDDDQILNFKFQILICCFS